MPEPKVIGVGLNKTSTKSLGQCLQAMGYHHQSYSLHAFHLYQQRDFDALFAIMDQFDSFEDWPWPLMLEEIDTHYPDAKFILTTRKSPDIWYKSLCKMAVRMGPMKQFEKHIYGYSMPHGHKSEHIEYYERHNNKVRAWFAQRPGKLLEISFDTGVSMQTLSSFLGKPRYDFAPPHENVSAPVYAGDSLWPAHYHRVVFQARWYSRRWLLKLRQRLRIRERLRTFLSSKI